MGKGQLRVTKVPAATAGSDKDKARILFVIKLDTREKVMVNGAPVSGMAPSHTSKPGKKGKVQELLNVQLAVQGESGPEVKSFMFRVKDKDVAARALAALKQALQRY